MIKAELLEILKRCSEDGDKEKAHAEADDALIAFINDAEIKKAFDAIDKWYA